MDSQLTINTGSIKPQRIHNKEESKMEEIYNYNLKREENSIVIQNNHTICYICQKEISVDFCKPFSCNHFICSPCISKLIIRENFNFLLIEDFKDRNYIKANINCSCGKGKYSSEIYTVQRDLNDALIINKPKGIKCHKHFESVTHYCSNCEKEICEKCIKDHNEEKKK